jgi:alanyl-tRNA synthetase
VKVGSKVKKGDLLTDGFPLEMTVELASEKKIKVDVIGFEEAYRKHQELSKTTSAGAFKSGLADNSEQTTRLHTATHMLNEALRQVLGNDVKQRGSNITPERLRFDFNFPRKLTEEEIKNIEHLVNQKVKAHLDVVRDEVSFNDAIKSGAQAEFGHKYPEKVSTYTIKDTSDKRKWFSKEICTGPHVKNTKEVGHFKIIKEESAAAGIRRIKATVS